MTQSTDSKAQKVLPPDYKRLRFKKLIPKLLREDFGINNNSWVKNKVLNVDIVQGRNNFWLCIKKTGDNRFILSYKYGWHQSVSNDFKFDTVSELYSFIKRKLKEDGLLTKDELMVKDIIV